MEISFDKKLKKINMIKWIPWIGDNYKNSKTKLLVLGESHYKWEGKGAWTMLNSIQFEKNYVIEHYIKVKEGNENKISVLDNLLRALYNKKDISSREKYLFAQNISYCTIIQRALKNIKERPNKEDFLEGWKIVPK